MSRNGVRQLGIQEIDGLALASSISSISHRVEDEKSFLVFIEKFETQRGRPGPVFVEWCLDAQAIPVDSIELQSFRKTSLVIKQFRGDGGLSDTLPKIWSLLKRAQRPVILIGAGFEGTRFEEFLPKLKELGIPLQFTWNAAEYLSFDHNLNFGRPNTWGQLDANLILQQCDLLVALGSRLCLQQTGFAWEDFVPLADIVQVDIHLRELSKARPKINVQVQEDAAVALEAMLKFPKRVSYCSWLQFTSMIREAAPTPEGLSSRREGYIQPQEFLGELCQMAPDNAYFNSSSSGVTFTVSMQTMELRKAQRLVSNKGLASMGSGTPGSIGLALADKSRVTICIEGDGGFAQNLQELGTVAVQKLNIKFFIFANDGYASIRMTQKNYFDGAWIGCDAQTGVGLPNLENLAEAYGLNYSVLRAEEWRKQVLDVFSRPGAEIIEVPIDLEQTYLPKIGSRANFDGTMSSNPIHQMEPPLPVDLARRLLVFDELRPE